MSVQPKEILSVAKFLAAQSADESTNRSVINRAYYAAYHAAKSFHAALPTPGSVGDARGSHEQLIIALDNPTIPRTHSQYWTSKSVSKTLRLAFSARVTADYHIGENIFDVDAKRTMGQSEEILVRAGLA